MSSSVPSRSLPLTPFLAADGVLLLTALFIAWRSSGDLAGGALLGVILCTGLGAVLTVLPFVINDAREREASLAERQRELVDLVNSTTAVSLRWGTQWTAAATGLDSAAGLATRSLAAAERLPEVFQEKIDSFTRLLEQAELAAQARGERALQESAALADRAQQAGAVAADLERTLAGFGRAEAGLREQHSAIVTTLAEATTTRAQAAAAVTQLERTLAGFDGLNAGLREQHVSLAATLAEFPLATTRAHSAREELDARVSTASAQIEAHLARITTDADERLASTTNALALRLAGLEAALDSLTRQLDRVNTLAVTAPAPIAVLPLTAEPVVFAEPEPEPEPEPAPAPVSASTEPMVALPEKTRITVSPPPVVEVPAAPLSRKETIMDPFYIPHDGYSALADAMDGGQS